MKEKELSYNLSFKEVVEILQLINQSETCKEFHLEMGDLKLTVVRWANGASLMEGVVKSKPENGEFGEQAAPVPVAEMTEPKDKNQRKTELSSGVEVKSPMVGTFYRTPSPGEAPFVEVGSHVKEEDIIGIIDVMKLMNTIKAGHIGIIREICVENEQMVEYGQVLMMIETV